MRLQTLNGCSVSMLGAIALIGCAAELGPSEDVSESEAALRGSPQTIAFEQLTDPEGVGTAAEEETRVLIETAEEYEALFGHAPPADVDFAGGEVVVFYSAGTQPTGGYEASILSITQRGKRLRITTQLVSPGEDCIVTQALTQPYALATFVMPAGIKRVRFAHEDVVRDCSEEDPCAAVRCAAGTVCEVQPDGSAACVPSGTFCGGIAGFLCPGAGSCIDDPADDCDPNMGGADCGGMCVCNAMGLCVDGFVWDESPEICGCVPVDGGDVHPCAAVLCPVNSTCELQNGEAVCVPADAQQCGNATCDAGQVCCNWSCGICTPPDGACTQQFCGEEPEEPAP
jgi:hypothetical protein